MYKQVILTDSHNSANRKAHEHAINIFVQEMLKFLETILDSKDESLLLKMEKNV